MTKCAVNHDFFGILADPALLPSLEPADQGAIIARARNEALLGYLSARIDLSSAEARLSDHLLSARIVAQFYDTRISWEIRSLQAVLEEIEGPVVLLKGAAYKALDLGLAQGRLASDVDLMLPESQLPAAESLLLSQGWEHVKADDYDQHYYRRWMHELPPLRHRERGTIVDLHHNILPRTARIKLDARALLTRSHPIPGSKFFSLAAEDAFLHRCVHLFVDGDLRNSVRELVDLRELLHHYMQDVGFRESLLPRAEELNLVIPLYYAIYFCNKLLHWSAPEEWKQDFQRLMREAGFRTVLIRSLMERQLRSADAGSFFGRQQLTGFLLFLRSHWLRMPPILLAKHLLTQVWRRRGLKAGD